MCTTVGLGRSPSEPGCGTPAAMMQCRNSGTGAVGAGAAAAGVAPVVNTWRMLTPKKKQR